jgi:hypothetical protein
MRVLRVLTNDETERTLAIASNAMRAIVGLLPLCDMGEVIIPEETRVEEVIDLETRDVEEAINISEDEEESIEVDESDMGLFKSSTPLRDHSRSETFGAIMSVTGTVSRKVALLKKIRYEVRGMMADAVAAMIRLASLLKLTAAITLSTTPDMDEEGILPLSLEILVRLATINKAAEEVATEIPEVNSLFELSILRPVEQLGCLSKMANGAIESIERQFKGEELSAFFTRQLTAVTTVINKGRRDRKISLLNLAVSNPAKAAALKLNKSKRKNEKKKESKKLGIKRIKGLIH